MALVTIKYSFSIDNRIETGPKNDSECNNYIQMSTSLENEV